MSDGSDHLAASRGGEESHDRGRRERARAALLDLPRAGLIPEPTPLTLLERFSAEVGAEIWIKRDDWLPIALAGNKIRKFDLVLGDAVRDGCDVLVTTGAVQSNSARAGAAAAAALGLDCVLVLSGDEPVAPVGNVLLSRLMGADIRFVGDVGWDRLARLADQVADSFRSAGRRVVSAPVGCSSPLGTLGFAVGYLELATQLAAEGLIGATIVHASSSGGTHAGLLVGRTLCPDDGRIVGVDVAAMWDDPADSLAHLSRQAGEIIGLAAGDTPSPNEIEIAADGVGEGYALHSQRADAAIRLLARTEAVFCDPIYTGKALACLIDRIRDDELSGPIVFWHTGGFHALFDPAHGTPLCGDITSVRG